jgi:large subunit ribosomal protein L3
MKERSLGLLGKKLGMTQYFDASGKALGVTAIQLGPCVVLDKRTQEKDGYVALVLGFDDKPKRKINKAEAGALKKAGGEDKAKRFVFEIRVSEDVLKQYEIGQEIKLQDLGLNVGDKIDVMGQTIGKGFQGVIKRHHMAGFPGSHGTHEYFRHGGSIGCRKWPGRVFKGRRMPGHMGNKRVTTQNIRVVQVREDNVLLVNGSIPGAKNGYLLVRPAVKVRTKSQG